MLLLLLLVLCASEGDEISVVEFSTMMPTSSSPTAVEASLVHGAIILAKADGPPREGHTQGFLDTTLFSFGVPPLAIALFLFVAFKASSETFMFVKGQVKDLAKIIINKWNKQTSKTYSVNWQGWALYCIGSALIIDLATERPSCLVIYWSPCQQWGLHHSYSTLC